MEPETKPRPNRDVHGSNGSDGGHNNGGNGSNNSGNNRNNRNNNRHSLSCPLTREESYQNDHLTHAAFVSIAILTFITFVGNFTQLQLSAALPTIVSDFGISVTTGQWLTSIFQLVMGVMVPLTAYLTRRFSTRQIVIASMAVFTLGSVFAWLGSSFVLVLIGRLLEAVGTGVMWPVLQITVFSIYPLSRRGMAMGTVGMAMSVAPAIGPTLGGVQTDLNGWRSIFLTLTVIGVISLFLAIFGLRNFGTRDASAKADFFSVGLSIFGFGGLMFGFTNIESYPFTHPMVWLAMLIGVVGIVWFVLRQIHGARRQSADPSKQPPLLNLSVLKNKSFTVGTVTAALSFFAFSSIMVIMPLYIQDCRGYSATISGLVMLPGAFGQCIAQFFGGKALDRFGARPVALIGSITLLFGTIMMSLISMTSWILVGVHLAVRAPDRYGIRAYADHHMVAELPGARGGERRFGRDEYGPPDRRCHWRSRAGDSDGNVHVCALGRARRLERHVCRGERVRHPVGAARERHHLLHHGGHGLLRRPRQRRRLHPRHRPACTQSRPPPRRLA